MKTHLYHFALLFITCATIGNAALGAGSSESADEISARAVERLTAAYRARDGQAYAALFWPDAELMNVFGQIVTGHDQIEALTNTVFRGALKDRVVHMEI